MEPTKPRRVDLSHASMAHRSNQKPSDRQREHSQHDINGRPHKSKESLDKLLQGHLMTKQQLEEQEFLQRGELLESSAQRNRRERIVRMVKSKVHEMKINALKKEASKKTLGG